MEGVEDERHGISGKRISSFRVYRELGFQVNSKIKRYIGGSAGWVREGPGMCGGDVGQP